MSLGSEKAGEQRRPTASTIVTVEDGAAVAIDERREAHCVDADGGAVGQALLAPDDDRVAGLRGRW